MIEAFPALEIIALSLAWALLPGTHRLQLWLFAALLFLAISRRCVRFGEQLYRNLYPVSYIKYYVPGMCLYSAALIASWWKNTRGSVAMEGPELSIWRSVPSTETAAAKDAMIRITRKVEFSAAHFYHNPNFSAEENRRVFGKCNNPHGHGHNYTLEVTIAGEPDPATGMVLDLKELKDILQREVMDRMDHRHLNYEVPELAGKIPTCENIAAVIWQLLEPKITPRKARSRAVVRIARSFR